MHRPNQDLLNLKYSCLYLFPFAHKVVPQFVPYFGLFRAFEALRALKSPQIKLTHTLMHRPYQDLQNLKFTCPYLFPFSHKVVPQKASGRGGGMGEGRIPHFNWSIYSSIMVSKVRNFATTLIFNDEEKVELLIV